MMRWTLPLTATIGRLVLGAGLLAGQHCAFALSPDQLYDKVSPSVWVVIAPLDDHRYESGSAVVIAPHLLVTNCHVINHGRSIEVRHQGVRYPAQLAAADPARDLCTLRAPNVNAPPVSVSPLASLRVGQRIYTVGAPGGYELTLSDGLISGLLHERGSAHITRIQISAPISHGSSGGGLFNEDGNLIGVTSAMVPSGENLNFAIPAEWIASVSQRTHLANDAAMAPEAAPPAPELAQNPPQWMNNGEGPPPAPSTTPQAPALPPGYQNPPADAPMADAPMAPPAGPPGLTEAPAGPSPGATLPPFAPSSSAPPDHPVMQRVITGDEFLQWMNQLHDFNAQTPAHSVMHITLNRHQAAITNTTRGASASAVYAVDRARSLWCLSQVEPQSFAPMQTCYRMVLRDDRILELQSIDSPYHLRMRVID